MIFVKNVASDEFADQDSRRHSRWRAGMIAAAWIGALPFYASGADLTSAATANRAGLYCAPGSGKPLLRALGTTTPDLSSEPDEISETVLVRAAYERQVVEPAQYQVVTETAIGSGPRFVWKQGVNLSPVSRVDPKTGEVYYRVEEPPETRTFTRVVEIKPESVRTETVPAEYKTLTRPNPNKAQPKKLAQPAPTRLALSDEAVLCADALRPGIVRRLQRILSQEGDYQGPKDGTLRDALTQALQAFQTRRDLPANGQLSVASLRALGLDDLVPAEIDLAAIDTGTSGSHLAAASEPFSQNLSTKVHTQPAQKSGNGAKTQATPGAADDSVGPHADPGQIGFLQDRPRELVDAPKIHVSNYSAQREAALEARAALEAQTAADERASRQAQAAADAAEAAATPTQPSSQTIADSDSGQAKRGFLAKFRSKAGDKVSPESDEAAATAANPIRLETTPIASAARISEEQTNSDVAPTRPEPAASAKPEKKKWSLPNWGRRKPSDENSGDPSKREDGARSLPTQIAGDAVPASSASSQLQAAAGLKRRLDFTRSESAQSGANYPANP